MTLLIGIPGLTLAMSLLVSTRLIGVGWRDVVSGPLDGFRAASAVGVVYGSFLALFLMLAIPIVSPLGQTVTTAFGLRNDPEATLFAALVRTVLLLHSGSIKLHAIARRNRICVDLETAARAAEDGLGGKLRVPSFTMAAELQSKLSSLATALRLQQLVVAYPGRTSAEATSKFTIAVMVAILDGSIADVELPAVSIPLIRQKMVHRVFSFAKSLLVAFVPLIGVSLLSKFSVLASGPVSQTIWTIALVWAVIGVLHMLDPLFLTKIDAFREMKEILRPDKDSTVG
jgi:hypothetical protein